MLVVEVKAWLEWSSLSWDEVCSWLRVASFGHEKKKFLK